jgi:hypothetical protein
MKLVDRAHQRFLHEIVSPVFAPCKCPRIASKPWNFALDESMNFGHSFFPLRTPIWGLIEKNLVLGL